MKIVFICTGNTCRSPMAEGFLKQIAENNNDSSLEVVSRGIAANEGCPASKFSIEAAKEYGVDISKHVSCQLTVDDVNDADLILTVTSEHCVFLKNELKKMAHKIFFVGEYVECDDIADPYGGNLETYQKCASDIYEACKLIYNKLSVNEK